MVRSRRVGRGRRATKGRMGGSGSIDDTRFEEKTTDVKRLTELVKLVMALKCTKREKLQILFNIFDSKGNGFWSKEDAKRNLAVNFDEDISDITDADIEQAGANRLTAPNGAVRSLYGIKKNEFVEHMLPHFTDGAGE